MRRLLFVCLLAWLAFTSADGIARDLMGDVAEVSDEGVVSLVLGGRTERIRLGLLLLPEVDQAYGPEARTRLRQMLVGKRATARTMDILASFPPAALIYVEQQNVTLQALAEGLGWLDRGQSNDIRYRTVEDKARRSGVGLWAQGRAVYPEEYRRQKRVMQHGLATMKAMQPELAIKAQRYVLANRTTGEYFPVHCGEWMKVPSSSLQIFAHKAAAEHKGFRLSDKCGGQVPPPP